MINITRKAKLTTRHHPRPKLILLLLLLRRRRTLIVPLEWRGLIRLALRCVALLRRGVVCLLRRVALRWVVAGSRASVALELFAHAATHCDV